LGGEEEVRGRGKEGNRKGRGGEMREDRKGKGEGPVKISIGPRKVASPPLYTLVFNSFSMGLLV